MAERIRNEEFKEFNEHGQRIAYRHGEEPPLPPHLLELLQQRSPDTLSPLWPERPIRPLPKNRLSSRLSPEQADGIVYPPTLPTSSPLFSFPYGLTDATDGRRVNGHRHASPTHCTCGGDHDESEEEETAYDHPSYRWSSPAAADGARMDSVQRKLMDASRGPLKPPPAPPSIASSADGYESFENTSNKKKRKIPVSSSSGMHQSQLSAELANMGISSPSGVDASADQVNGDSHGYANGIGGTGISGAGRGRFGRQNNRPERNGRPNGGLAYPATGAYQSSISAKSRGGNWRGDGTRTRPDQDQGIISAAIANAAEQPSTPPKGKENVSLLSQQSPKSTTPKTQFTFTCESDSSNKMVWPGQNGAPYGTPTPQSQPLPYAARGVPGSTSRPLPPQAAHGAQTGSLRGGGKANATMPGSFPPPAPNAPLPPNEQPKQRRRRPSKEFALAARQRRLQQEYNNFHHKPKKEDMWICEFCEYEDIFGVPPLALMRQYEIKDRAERQKQEERRRLLEKAKMKKGKGKKGGKGGKNNNAQNPPPANGQAYDPALDHVPLPPDGQGDEYYDDEYDDGYESVTGGDPVDPGARGAYQAGFQDYGPDTYGEGGRGQHTALPAPAA